MNPEYFDIENLKMFGMWPNGLMLSKGIIPYIKRKGANLNINIVDDLKGENAYDMLDQCSNIEKLYMLNKTVDDQAVPVLQSNLDKFSRDKFQVGFLHDEADITCVLRSSCNVDDLKNFYDTLKPGGIFCGNDHDNDGVKEALTIFRRKNRIGTPIQISNRTIWFWIKG